MIKVDKKLKYYTILINTIKGSGRTMNVLGNFALLSGAGLLAFVVKVVIYYFVIRLAVKHGIQDSKK